MNQRELLKTNLLPEQLLFCTALKQTEQWAYHMFTVICTDTEMVLLHHSSPCFNRPFCQRPRILSILPKLACIHDTCNLIDDMWSRSMLHGHSVILGATGGGVSVAQKNRSQFNMFLTKRTSEIQYVRAQKKHVSNQYVWSQQKNF